MTLEIFGVTVEEVIDTSSTRNCDECCFKNTVCNHCNYIMRLCDNKNNIYRHFKLVKGILKGYNDKINTKDLIKKIL